MRTFSSDRGLKLYISVHPAAETKPLIRPRACVETVEYSRRHAERKTWACQLKCPLL